MAPTATGFVKVLDGSDNEVEVIASQGTVTEYNITLTNADTEYSQTLPANAKAVTFRCRTPAECRFAWTSGKVAGPTAPYQTLRADAEYHKENLLLGSKTIYFASSTAGVVIEMEVWS